MYQKLINDFHFPVKLITFEYCDFDFTLKQFVHKALSLMIISISQLIGYTEKNRIDCVLQKRKEN